MQKEKLVALEGNALAAGVMNLGQVSQYTCPDCHGVLVQIEEGRIVRFRCSATRRTARGRSRPAAQVVGARRRRRAAPTSSSPPPIRAVLCGSGTASTSPLRNAQAWYES